jgi:hypothetical protein
MYKAKPTYAELALAPVSPFSVVRWISSDSTSQCRLGWRSTLTLYRLRRPPGKNLMRNPIDYRVVAAGTSLAVANDPVLEEITRTGQDPEPAPRYCR